MRKVHFTSLVITGFFLLLFTGCSKRNDSKSINYYFKGTINNEAVELLVEEEKDDVYTLAFETRSRMPVGMPPVSFFTESALGSSIFDIRPGSKIGGLSIYIVKKIPENYTLADRKNVIQPGSYPFGKHGQNSFGVIEEGGIVRFHDINGVAWYSERGANNSPGNSFEVIEKSEWTKDNALIIWKVKINCNLYNDNGNSIRINGEFRAQALNP